MGIFTCVLIITNLFLLGCLYRIAKEIQKRKQQLNKLEVIRTHAIAELENSQELNETYLSTLDEAHKQLQNIYAEIDTKSKELDKQIELLDKSKHISESAFEAFFDALEMQYAETEKEYSEKLENLQQSAIEEYDTFVEKLQAKYEKKQSEFNDLTSTVTAINDTIRRLDADKATKAIYQLNISDDDLLDVKALLKLCETFKNPRVIRMIIWQSYFQKETNNLCTRVEANDICGIYKITNVLNNKVYIGQAKNIADRWKQHIKCGLGIDTPATNSFYKAMMQDGVWSFTFEILEKCDTTKLNDCERKWISLFEADTIGYNGNKGVKTK